MNLPSGDLEESNAIIFDVLRGVFLTDIVYLNKFLVSIMLFVEYVLSHYFDLFFRCR